MPPCTPFATRAQGFYTDPQAHIPPVSPYPIDPVTLLGRKHMNMNMRIVMNMNIYIRPELEERLRAYGGSMSGLVNQLLETHFALGSGTAPKLTVNQSPSGNVGSTPTPSTKTCVHGKTDNCLMKSCYAK